MRACRGRSGRGAAYRYQADLGGGFVSGGLLVGYPVLVSGDLVLGDCLLVSGGLPVGDCVSVSGRGLIGRNAERA